MDRISYAVCKQYKSFLHSRLKDTLSGSTNKVLNHFFVHCNKLSVNMRNNYEVTYTLIN